ncbi:MAG: serine/threonine-protein kinase [Planctomycetota bacterium]
MSDDSEHELLDELADEFLSRCLRGESPKIADYCQAYPWIADEIQKLFPMLKLLESNKDSRDSFQPPNPLGSYRLDREIGRGGMAIVYEATATTDGQKVALKLLHPQRGNDQAAVNSRFEREAEVISRVDCEGIVRLVDFGEHDGLAYLVMQLIDGSSLDRLIRLLASARRSNPTDWVEPVMRGAICGRETFTREEYFGWVKHVGERIATALHRAHEMGVLHRDVKPSNVLLDREGEPWLTDFGLARLEDSKLTRTGQIIGTLRYLAPERLSGKCDESADIYGLGLTLYELLTLRPAFSQSDRLQLVAAVEQSEPPPPNSIMPDIPEQLEEIVLRAMAKSQHARYQTCAELAAELKNCDATVSVAEKKSRLAVFRRKPFRFR